MGADDATADWTGTSWATTPDRVIVGATWAANLVVDVLGKAATSGIDVGTAMADAKVLVPGNSETNGNSDERETTGAKDAIPDGCCKVVACDTIAAEADDDGPTCEMLPPKLEFKKIVDRVLPPHAWELLPEQGV
ncbi:hypothetical protein E8E11_000234 [Didymella keratinophila]|nr:hypothetical protein E8E11_000234 [Didymella keratinophila]